MRYRSSIDLGIFIGARYIEEQFTPDGPKIPGIFIPVGINGIRVDQDTRAEDRRNPSGFRAFINFQQRYASNAYIDAVKQSLQRKGEVITAYNVPSHSMCYTLPEATRTRIRQALAPRVIAAHPEWQGQTEETCPDLRKAISTLMPFQMGDCYLIEEQTQTSAAPTQTSAPISQSVSGYVPQQASFVDPHPEDADLPF